MNAAATLTATIMIDSRRKKTLLAVALLLVVVGVANLFVMVTVFVLKLCDVEDLMVA